MFRNYLKTAWRNLVRNKTFSLLNIVGLAVGIACASLIFLWVGYHLTFNHSIPDYKNIYEIENNQSYGSDMVTFPVTSVLVKDALQREFPGVVNVSRYDDADGIVSSGDKRLSLAGAYVDSAFFKMFGLPLVEGNVNDVLNDISQIAISQKLAKTYFGNSDALGKTLLVDNNPYKVSAVYKDIPQDVQFYGEDFFLPFEIYYDQNKDHGMNSWGSNWASTWVELNPGTNVISFNSRLGKLIERKDPQVTNQSLWLYPMERLKLYGEFTNGKEDTSKATIQDVKRFSILALIILTIACINFMNLSTARSEKRAGEIGVRKALGSTKASIIRGLLAESLIVAYVAVVLAVVIVAVALPYFNSLINIHLYLHMWYSSHILFLVIIGGIAGLIAGSYPAFYLSSFNPIQSLKGQIAKNAGNASIIRKGLVIMQFAVSVIIIISVFVVYRQIKFTKNRDFGFKKDNILYVPASSTLQKGYNSLKQDILNTNEVSSITIGRFSPISMYNNGGGWMWEGKNAKEDVLVTNLNADADYLKTFGIQLQAGRAFSPDPNIDGLNVIINESFAKIMGKAGHVGGQILRENYRLTIVGIMKDFVYNDMNERHPAPLIYFNNPHHANYIYMKLNPTDDLQGIISKLRNIFRKADGLVPFDYHFIDEDFDRRFHDQQFIGSLATIFGCLAIFISCLGLFGLSAFMAEQRKKEVGLRKVLGASVSSIFTLLSKDFLILVILSLGIAFPIAYWIMHGWLQKFDYRIGISWYLFVAAALLALLIAFATVSFQAIRAARANPLRSLRME